VRVALGVGPKKGDSRPAKEAEAPRDVGRLRRITASLHSCLKVSFTFKRRERMHFFRYSGLASLSADYVRFSPLHFPVARSPEASHYAFSGLPAAEPAIAERGDSH